MIFLGTLDDKTIEFPNGLSASKNRTVGEVLIEQILFNEQPVAIEEGFVFASEEAINLGSSPQILLPGIEAGLISVVARDGTFADYVNDRRAMQHAAPPNNLAGNAYVERLETACGMNATSGRRLRYPPSEIDNLTFERLRQLLREDSVRAECDIYGLKIPATFRDEYSRNYRYGNNGGQWTARAAWEATARIMFADEPNAVHYLMIVANRERQIIRAAATAKQNHLKDMMVETGMRCEDHEFARAEPWNSPMQDAAVDRFPCPRVPIAQIIEKADLVFTQLAKEDSNLATSRKAYLGRLAEFRGEGTDRKRFQAASDRYEIDLFDAIRMEPEERTKITNAVSFGAGAVASSTTAPLFKRFYRREVGEELTFAEGKDFPRNRSQIERKLNKAVASRRDFFKFGLGATFAAGSILASHGMSGEAEGGFKTLVRKRRVGEELDTGDVLVNALKTGSSIVERLRINMDALGDIPTE